MDLEEDLKWFEENSASQTLDNHGYSNSQDFPASSGGSGQYASRNQQQTPQQQQQPRYVQPAAPYYQQEYQQTPYHQSATPLYAMRTRNPAFPPAAQANNHSGPFQARPDLQAQSRFQGAPQGRHQQAVAPQTTMVTQPPRTSNNTRPDYVQSPDGSRFFIKKDGSLIEIDPIAHGLLLPSPQRVASPSGPALYRSNRSSSNLRGTALHNSARTRSAAPQGFQRASQSFVMSEEDMFDQIGDDMDWDAIPLQPSAATQRFQHAQHRQPAPSGRYEPNFMALQQALQAERQRANMAENMLSRIHRQPSHPNLSSSSQSGEALLSSPSASHRIGTQHQQQQQRTIFAESTNTSFEFDPNFRQTQQAGGGAEHGDKQQASSALEKQKKATGASTWGLPSNDRLLTLRKSAYVPPMNSASNIASIPKSAISDIFSTIFTFQTFNQVQSACFPIIMKTDENIVVTAPTGAGKTVLFELAMIRLWQKEKEGQVVYIAPTKSLCSERVRDWTTKFSNMSLKCVELTGDTHEGALREAKNARVIVTTPEKWDSVTRNLRGGVPWYDAVKVFCIDEVHLLAEERGATLEVIVSRMKAVNADMRFVAVSATVPNIEDVAVWLGPGRIASGRPISKDAEGNELPPMARVMKFGDEFRPVPLQKYVHGYPCGNKSDQQFDASLNYKLLELIEKYAGRKPVLVFCNTRKGCVTAAKQLMKDYREHRDRRSSVPPWPTPVNAHASFEDSSLGELAAAGIGIHHAGMAMKDRRLTESLYLKGGSLHVLCTTSTLAVGINLPARMVIIKGTKIWDGAQGKAVDYSDLDILQMMGRAGRPQFDNHGVAVIMCKQDEKAKYEAMVKSETILESCLHKTLVEHINSEIATKTIKKLDDAYRWLRSSFLYVRIKANPEHYRSIVTDFVTADDEDGEDLDDIVNLAPAKAVNPEKRLEEMVAEAVKQLIDEGLAEELGDEFGSTDYGDMLCQYNIRLATFLSLKNMERGASPQQLLAQMCKAVEFKDMKFRSGEKTQYAEWNTREEMEWPIKKVAETSDKVNILLQLQIGGITPWELKIAGSNTAGECMQIMQHMKRMASCVVDLATHNHDAVMSKSALKVARCIRTRCWEDTYSVLSQFDEIGSKKAQALSQLNVNTVQDLRRAKPDIVEKACGRVGGKNFGRNVITHAREMPDFQVTGEIMRERVKTNGVLVTCAFTISLKNVESVRITTGKGAKKLTASILLSTSDDQWIDYKRAKILTLKQDNDGKGMIFKKSVLLTKPSQKIECSVACDEFAGLHVKGVIAPSTPAAEYPIPNFADDEDDEPAEKTKNSGSDVDDDGDVIVKTKALKRPSNKSVKNNEVDQDGKLPNGNYKCRHDCKGACKHACCVSGVIHKPKENVKKRGKVQKANYTSDSESEASGPSTKTKKPARKSVRRSAQEIANSMKGSSELTTTGIKLDRIKRKSPSGKTSDPFPGRLRAASDSEDTDTLPEPSAALEKFRSKVGVKRTRDPSPDNDYEDPSAKKSREAPAELEDTTPTSSSPPSKRMPRARSATILASPPRSPRQFKKNIMASPPSPSPERSATTGNKIRKKQQPLFRPPSVEANPFILSEAAVSGSEESDELEEDDDEKTEESSQDELEDTGEWLEKNVEITD